MTTQNFHITVSCVTDRECNELNNLVVTVDDKLTFDVKTFCACNMSERDEDTVFERGAEQIADLLDDDKILYLERWQ